MDYQARTFGNQRGRGARKFERARRAVLKRIKAIAVLPFLFALAMAGIVPFLLERYDASAVIQIDPRQPAHTEESTPASLQELERLTVESAIERLQSPPVIDRVIEKLALERDAEFAASAPAALLGRLLQGSPSPLAKTRAVVSNRLNVSRVRHTLLLNVSFSSADPAKAARIANAIADAYLDDQLNPKWRLTAHPIPPARDNNAAESKTTASQRVFESFLATYGQELQLPDARIVNRADAPRSAAAPKRKRLIALAAAAGLAIALALALALELREPRRPRVEDVQRAFACPHMISGPSPAEKTATPPPVAEHHVFAGPGGPYTEAVRSACEALGWNRGPAPSRVVLVTSALPREGAELFASNLALHMALTGNAALLVDADFKEKGLTRRLAGQSTHGFLDQIASQRPVEEAILRDGRTGLHFLPAAGPAPIALSVPDALRSPAMAIAAATIKEHFAPIVLLAPPLLSTNDGRGLADMADEIVFVSAWHKTPRHLARKALASLGANQHKVAGAVLTDVRVKADDTIMSFSDIVAEIRRAATFPRRAA